MHVHFYNQHGDLLIFTKSWIIYRIIVTIIDLSWECPGNKVPSQKCPRIVHTYVIVFLIANLALLIPGTIDFFSLCKYDAFAQSPKNTQEFFGITMYVV